MNDFPILKTGAVAQYPATRRIQFSTQAVRFLDGETQRYRQQKGALRQWVIRLSQLDEGELDRLDAFLAARQGAAGSFTFVDPWDNAEYENCTLVSDEGEFSASDLSGGRTVLVVRQNWS